MKNFFYLTPPRIIHSEGKPSKQSISDVINAAARNAKLTKKQTALLSFYANRSNGFTPAEKLVIKETGISERRLREVRNNLQNMNLIDYECSSGYHFIFINWLVIRGLALLDHPLDIGGKNHGFFLPMNQQVIKKHPKYFENERKKSKVLKYSIGKIDEKVSDEMKRWFQIIGQWTAEEYMFIVNSLMNAYGIKPVLPVEDEPVVHYYIPHSSVWNTSSWEDCFPDEDTPVQGEPLPF